MLRAPGSAAEAYRRRCSAGEASEPGSTEVAHPSGSADVRRAVTAETVPSAEAAEDGG
ncbi:hypothetical protein [Streptomyces sp. CC228A]|uniref:hypothetical protein n=1 Tax=Streptomyces sp. CC228A TaxID=2898186 RepID=UPI001F192968|nr:hypothetical protein [Streptomyces sp. CC228A]